LSEELIGTGDVVVVREHPFNSMNGRCLDLSGLPNVLLDQGPLDDLIEQADFFLLTLSTLQFELALRGNPLDLLARSLLSGPGEAPFRGDFGACSAFLQAFTDPVSWRARQAALERRIGFLYEHQLLDLHPDAEGDAAGELADLLSSFNGASVSEAVDGLASFLGR
jgi:hypothetical protein